MMRAKSFFPRHSDLETFRKWCASLPTLPKSVASSSRVACSLPAVFSSLMDLPASKRKLECLSDNFYSGVRKAAKVVRIDPVKQVQAFAFTRL